MLREHLFHKRAATDADFRWRGGEISRLEGLSDGVFAVTLTLLVVTLEVPTSYYELWIAVRDLPVFLVCFVMLMSVWNYHYLFFRRYGLEDGLTRVLNSAFLFVVLFYAYPLKFLATFLWRLVLGIEVDSMFAIPADVVWNVPDIGQRTGMMYFYGIGVAAVFGLLFLLVGRAYLRRDELELDTMERYLTFASMRSHAISVAVALASMLVLYRTGAPGFSGVVYFAMGPLQGFGGYLTGRRVRALRAELAGAK